MRATVSEMTKEAANSDVGRGVDKNKEDMVAGLEGAPFLKRVYIVSTIGLTEIG